MPTAARSDRPLKRAGGERRQQILEIARTIIETEGVEAMSMGRIAELAGCARPLVYRYFATREDLFFAITEEFYEGLDRRVTLADQKRAIVDSNESAFPLGNPVLQAVWEELEENGPAALILSELSPDLAEHHRSIREKYEIRWFAALLELGLNDTQATIVLDLIVATTKIMAIHHRGGRITREQAQESMGLAIASLITAFIPRQTAPDQ
jgi:AcrR family transcriptional regulator